MKFIPLILLVICLAGCLKTGDMSSGDGIYCDINGVSSSIVQKGMLFGNSIGFANYDSAGCAIYGDNTPNQIIMYVNTRHTKAQPGIKYYLQSYKGQYSLYSLDYTPADLHPYYADTTTSYVTFTHIDSSFAEGHFELHGVNDSSQTADLTSGYFHLHSY